MSNSASNTPITTQPSNTSNTNKESQNPPEDPDKYVYVSSRHYNRKKNIEDDKLAALGASLTRPGPLGIIVIYIFDAIVEAIARFLVYFSSFAFAGFDYVMAYTFGNFNGIFPNADKNGVVFRYRFFRYIINILIPPMGVFFSKGLYGWFNVFICLILTYVSYILGIIYCFVITANNRYADLYEELEYKKLKSNNENYNNNKPGDYWAFITVLILILLLLSIFIMAVKYI